MRVVFLLPALRKGRLAALVGRTIDRMPANAIGRWCMARRWTVDQVWGGTLNILRHYDVANLAGADAVIATTDGIDSYGDVFGDGRRHAYIRWRDRRSSDICIVPDFASRLVDEVEGPVVVYEQSPLHLRADFRFGAANVHIWTDSPFMQRRCETIFPGKPITVAPNIVDDAMFGWVPQPERTPGLLFAFPRKNPEFIEATRRRYAELGGGYWTFELVHGLRIDELARRFREPQAFLASARDEGCALPPQEAMSAGVVVVGRTAGGANFAMQDGLTSLNAETPEEAAAALRRLESAELRERLAGEARRYIARYFPQAEPLQFWQQQLGILRGPLRS